MATTADTVPGATSRRVLANAVRVLARTDPPDEVRKMPRPDCLSAGEIETQRFQILAKRGDSVRVFSRSKIRSSVG